MFKYYYDIETYYFQSAKILLRDIETLTDFNYFAMLLEKNEFKACLC